MQRFGYDSYQMDSLNSLISNSDSISLLRAISIVSKYGWLGKSEIGLAGNSALFLAIHAKDNNVRGSYYPLLEKSALIGELSLADMATMKDRMLVQNGFQQVYGTQLMQMAIYFPYRILITLTKDERK